MRTETLLALLISVSLYSMPLMASKISAEKSQQNQNFVQNEFKFLELKTKKELNDKKNSAIKKYTIAILAAREFRLLQQKHQAIEFYKLAQEYKVEVDKKEVKDALKNIDQLNENINSPLYFAINLKELIQKHNYEKAILAINPQALKLPENTSLRIIYDLLQVKFKKLNVKKLYCLDHADKDLDVTSYDKVLCDFLNEYLKEGKKEKSQMAFVEEYFLKNDLNERYLLNIVHDL